jgi:proline utilization trans-activator
MGLDKSTPASFSSLDREHRKRVWWTSYCLDKTTSTEMGWQPAFTGVGIDLEYPSNNDLSPEELEEFHAPEYLTAQAKLSHLKAAIIETVCRLRSDSLGKGQEISHSVEILQKWKSELPLHMSLDFDNRISEAMSKLPTVRTTVSLHLKYNQVSGKSCVSKRL